MAIRQNLQSGWKTAVDLMGRSDRSHTVLPVTKEARQFYRDLKQKGVSGETPVQLAGAIGARLFTDVADDATRHLYWRFNHPMAIADKLAEQAIGSQIYEYSAPKRAAIQLAAVGVPVSASLGTFDATNLGELGRPKGFAQSYAEQGSEDRRQTGQIAPELLDRYVLGRQGRPLKYETAKQDIPDLTKQRYANYMNFLYNDKGPLGVGVLKGTMENLQGEPEVRIVGFPVGLQAVGALAGGSLATAAALKQQTKDEVPGGIGPKQPRTLNSEDTSQEVLGKRPKDKKIYKKGEVKPSRGKGVRDRTGMRTDYVGPRTRTLAAMGGAGAITGALAGKLANRLLASDGQSDLPTTQEYGIS